MMGLDRGTKVAYYVAFKLELLPYIAEYLFIIFVESHPLVISRTSVSVSEC